MTATYITLNKEDFREWLSAQHYPYNIVGYTMYGGDDPVSTYLKYQGATDPAVYLDGYVLDVEKDDDRLALPQWVIDLLAVLSDLGAKIHPDMEFEQIPLTASMVYILTK